MGSLLDFALRQRCWQNFLHELWQEICPVGLGMKDRLLVVAASGEVVERVWVFHSQVASHERGASWEGGAKSSNDPISFTISFISLRAEGIPAFGAR